MTKPTSIRFAQDQIAELQRTAAANNRSISAEIVHRLFGGTTTLTAAVQTRENATIKVSSKGVKRKSVSKPSQTEGYIGVIKGLGDENRLPQRKTPPPGMNKSDIPRWMRENN